MIYQRYIIKDKEFKEKFDTTHMLLTENKPLLFSSYTNRLVGKKWFAKQDKISLIIFMKLRPDGGVATRQNGTNG